jgi:diadenosine tetraphosphatase ApaH/serine/threonine PP2A family protein phosphatase
VQWSHSFHHRRLLVFCFAKLGLSNVIGHVCSRHCAGRSLRAILASSVGASQLKHRYAGAIRRCTQTVSDQRTPTRARTCDAVLQNNPHVQHPSLHLQLRLWQPQKRLHGVGQKRLHFGVVNAEVEFFFDTPHFV